MAGPELAAEFFGLQDALRGEYSLEREIGRGGMGIVYLARDVALDRPVAIKVLPSALAANADLRARFLREARTAAQLSHPNIVPIHRADERAGFAFFVMAFVDGDTLGERVRRTGPLQPKHAAKLLREVAWALAYANSRGIVHRDVKPDNILLERDTGRALVTDFGIAQVTVDQSALTSSGMVLGSAHFMSPEQAAGERLDGRSDLYSLGVVGYFALTGTLPFEGDNVQAIMAKHITQPAPRLELATPQPALTAAIDRALAKKPDDRFASGEDFAKALESSDVADRAVPMPIRAWLRPDTGSIVFVLGVIVLALSTVYARTIRTEPEGAWPLLMLVAILVGNIVKQTRAALAAGFSLDDLRAALHGDIQGRIDERRYVDAAGRIPESYAPGLLLGKKVSKSQYLLLAVVALVPLAAVLLISANGLIPSRLMGIVVILLMLPGFYEMATATTSGGPLQDSSEKRLWGDKSPSISIDGLVKSILASGNWIDRIRQLFWNSWAGNAIAAMARIGLDRRVSPSSAMATAEVIGLAVADLFGALPKDMRQRFASAVDITKKLEREAANLRARGDQPERLAIVVSALENVRLDLLKLHAGRSNADSLEAALKGAEELSRDISRTVAANEETARLLARSP